jgi:hypothetical protein
MSSLTPITLLASARMIVLDKAGLEPDRITDVDLTLDITAGSNGAICYRPWYAAAKLLEQNLDIQALKKADGAEFTGQETAIRSLYAMQLAIDQIDALDTPAVVVPAPLAVPTALALFNAKCGCQTGSVYPVMTGMVGAWW